MSSDRIFLQAIGPIDWQVMDFLKESLSCFWNAEILPGVEVPSEAYHKVRRQYEGSALYQSIVRQRNVRTGSDGGGRICGWLNYIIGLAVGQRAISQETSTGVLWFS